MKRFTIIALAILGIAAVSFASAPDPVDAKTEISAKISKAELVSVALETSAVEAQVFTMADLSASKSDAVEVSIVLLDDTFPTEWRDVPGSGGQLKEQFAYVPTGTPGVWIWASTGQCMGEFSTASFSCGAS